MKCSGWISSYQYPDSRECDARSGSSLWRSGSASRGACAKATSIPDFSGKWSPVFSRFEPAGIGAGPVVNKSRRRDGRGNANQLSGVYTMRS